MICIEGVLNWSEMNQSNCTIHGKKVHGAIFARCYQRREHSEGLWVIFKEYSDIVKNDVLKMQRFLDISRFLYSRVGRYKYVNSTPSNGWKSSLPPLSLLAEVSFPWYLADRRKRDLFSSHLPVQWKRGLC